MQIMGCPLGALHLTTPAGDMQQTSRHPIVLTTAQDPDLLVQPGGPEHRVLPVVCTQADGLSILQSPCPCLLKA